MTTLLGLTTILAWGCWIPVAQIMPGVSQSSRTFYVALGNAVFAASALAVGGGHVSFGWRGFWLPLAGGVVWTVGGYSAFRASESIGLARASGSWTPLNIIVAFVWGTLLFGELNSFSSAEFALLGVALVFVLAGILSLSVSQDSRLLPPTRWEMAPSHGSSARPRSGSRERPTAPARVSRRPAAGCSRGSYFVPAQWAKVPAQVANFPLALGILAGGTVLVMVTGGARTAEPTPYRRAAVGRSPLRHRRYCLVGTSRAGGYRRGLHDRPAQPVSQRERRHTRLQGSQARFRTTHESLLSASSLLAWGESLSAT